MKLDRRKLLRLGGILAASTVLPGVQAGVKRGDPADWLGTTRFIDYEHPTVSERASMLTAGKNDPLQKSLAIFRFVRDEVKFGFTRGFWSNSASDVLASGIGYCNTKSTLFVALLRASGIPARQVFVDIDSDVLFGIANPGTPYVDHSYVEIFLDGLWIPTDSYIVDEALFVPAQARALTEERVLAYGVHQTGSNQFTGSSASFSQFNYLDPRVISTTTWGVFADVGEFYSKSPRPWNRLNGPVRFAFGVLANAANRRADDLRRQG